MKFGCSVAYTCAYIISLEIYNILIHWIDIIKSHDHVWIDKSIFILDAHTHEQIEVPEINRSPYQIFAIISECTCNRSDKRLTFLFSQKTIYEMKFAIELLTVVNRWRDISIEYMYPIFFTISEKFYQPKIHKVNFYYCHATIVRCSCSYFWNYKRKLQSFKHKW